MSVNYAALCMKQIRFQSLQKILPRGILLLTLMGIYVETLAPGLTWANGGSDGGDLITAAATGGIAHPTGYPLYLILARLFQSLPIGTLAFRTNLMSALFTALTALIVFDIVTRSAASQENSSLWLAGLAAAYAFGLAPLVWSQAVITEVYALQSFLIALIIYLYTIPASHSRLNQLAGWRGLVLGLAVSNHVTGILLVPVALAIGCVRNQAHDIENPHPVHQGLLESVRKFEICHSPEGAPGRCERLKGATLAPGASAGENLGLLPEIIFEDEILRRRFAAPQNDMPKSFCIHTLDINFTALGRLLFWLGIGLSPYLLLPLRALANPPVNWGNPVTFERFWWLVAGRLYQSYYLGITLPEIWEHFQAGASLLLQQFGIIGVLIGLIGLVVYGSRKRIFILTIWIACVYATLAFLYRSEDSYVYLVPAFLCFALWLGIGLSRLIDPFIFRYPVLQLGFGLLIAGYFVVRTLTFIGDVDASHDFRAESFGKEVLSGAPKNSILFAQGDESIFTLWYFHFALGERPDLAVVAVDLLHFDWYQENLRSIYPALKIPGPFPWPETIAEANRSRAACHVQYRDHTEMDCSQPLKTSTNTQIPATTIHSE